MMMRVETESVSYESLQGAGCATEWGSRATWNGAK